MAIIKQGILGGFSGKVGNVVGSSWKGISVMKSMPVSVANPKTAGQVAQRGRFGNAVAFAQNILADVIKPLWDRFAIKQSGYNAFISRNIELFDAAAPSPAENLQISSGPMAATPITNCAGPGNLEVQINWADDTGEGLKLATDEAYVVVVNQATGAAKGYATGVTRDAAVLTVADAGEEDDDLHVYLAFRRADGTVVGETSYDTLVSLVM